MKKQLLTLLLIFTIFSLFSQTHTIEIHPNNRVASLLMSSTEYSDWKTNDHFSTNSTVRKNLIADIYEKFDDHFDFIFLILNETTIPTGLPYGQLIQVSNADLGLGLAVYDYSGDYGSSGKLKAVMHLTRLNLLETGPSLHELMHNWGNFGIPTEGTYNGTDFYSFQPHWGFTGGSTKGQLGGFKQSTLVENGGNSYTMDSFGSFANGGNSVPYNELELYLMGMIPITDVSSFDVLTDITSFTNNTSTFTVTANTKTNFTPTSLETLLGARIPSSTTSQKDFKLLNIVLTDTPLTTDQWNTIDMMSERFGRTADNGSVIYNFWEATGGIGTIETGNLDTNLLGFENNIVNESIHIYPNPSNDNIQIRGLNNPENYIIFDAVGKEILNGRINNNQKININSLTNGFYFIITETGKKLKFIKK